MSHLGDAKEGHTEPHLAEELRLRVAAVGGDVHSRAATGVTLLCYCRGELGGSSILYGPTTPNQLSQTWVPIKTKTNFYTDLYTLVQTTQMCIRK